MSTPSKAYWVKWVDSTTHEGHAWRTKKDLDALTPLTCELVGFIYKVTPEYVIFICCRNFGNDEDQEYWGEFALHHSAILEIKELRHGKAVNLKKLKDAVR